MTVALVANIARPISSAISTAFSADSYGLLSSYGLLGASANPDAVIKALFANSEVGAWYDPSDLSTMFQDSAGTTPVTADGQTVGLILDKSKWLVLGPELVTNGDFTVDTGWTLGPATISGGVLACSADISYILAYQPVTFGTPKHFYLTVTVSGYVSGSCVIVFGVGANVYSPFMTSNGTYTFRILSGLSNSELRVLSGGSGFVGNIDNISVKELPGNHATAPSDAARPLYKTDGTYHWLQFDGVDDSLSTAAIDFTSTDKISVFCGVKKSANTDAILLEFGPTTTSTNGTFYIGSDLFASTDWDATLRGSVSPAAIGKYITGFGSPVSSILSVIYDLAQTTTASEITFRIDGSPIAGATAGASAGSGNFSSQNLYIGSRTNTSIIYNGSIYSLILRGTASSSTEISQTEGWVNTKTAAVLLGSVAALGDSLITTYSGSVDIFAGMTSAYIEENLAIGGHTITQQNTVWTGTEYKSRFKWVGIQVGLNDLAPAEAASVAISRLQAFVSQVRADIPAGSKVLVGKLTPCKQLLIDTEGAVNGAIAYQKWLDINEAIGGGGATPITGADVIASNHVAALNDGSGNLAAAYDSGDHIHANNAGRQLISDSWVAALQAVGITV